MISKLRGIAILFMCLFLLSSPNTIWAADEVPSGNLVTLQVLTVNDFHGALIESGKNPGAAKLATCILENKAANPNGTLILSAGDMFQGTPDSNLLYGKSVVQVMNALPFDAMALGNHEFDWGLPILKERIAQSTFPYLSANLIDKTTGKPADFIKPYVIFQRKGVSIAVIGITTPQTAYTSNMEVVSHFQFEAPEKIINQFIPELKQQKVDFILVLSHLASFQNPATGDITDEAADLIQASQGLQGVVTGHSHQVVAGYVEGIPVVQAGFSGRAVGKMDFIFNKATGKVAWSKATVLPLPYEGLKANPTVAAIVEQAQKEIAPVKNLVLGKNLRELSHDRTTKEVTFLGQWVTDVMRETAHADIAFQNAGGLRVSLPEGAVTTGKMYEILPFDNTVVTVDLTGRQVAKVVEHGLYSKKFGMVEYSGIKVQYNPTAPENQRVQITMADGSSFDMNKTYKVATNDFMFSGGDEFTMFKEGINAYDTNLPLRDLLINAIKKIQVLDVQKDDRFITTSSLALTSAA